jgi:hypothetical protein
MTRFSPKHAGDPYRYGIYLRPDPRTCAAVTTITTQLRAQYGLVSAGAFPPHATLAGSEHLGRDEDAIVSAVTKALDGIEPFPVVNSGLRRDPGAGPYLDINQLTDGTPNAALHELAAAVAEAVAPLRLPAEDPEPNFFDPGTFHAHLSLASHDLYERPDLADEVDEFVRGLAVDHPPGFTGEIVTLYRTCSDDWTGRWWHTLTWEHLCTWRLGDRPNG